MELMPRRLSLRKDFAVQSSMQPVDPETSAKEEPAPRSTLSALDAMLGIQQTSETDARSEEEEQGEPFLTVPLIWKVRFSPYRLSADASYEYRDGRREHTLRSNQHVTCFITSSY